MLPSIDSSPPQRIYNNSPKKRLNGHYVNYNISSIDKQSLIRFIQSLDNHQQNNKQYLAQILLHFSQYREQAQEIALCGEFKIVKNKQALYRIGDPAEFCIIVLVGRLTQLHQDSSMMVFTFGEHLGDDQYHLKESFRKSCVFHSSSSPAVICQLKYSDYQRIFKKDVEMINKQAFSIKNKNQLFKNKEINQIKLIIKNAKTFQLRKNQILYDKGEPCQGIYLLLQGCIKQTQLKKCFNPPQKRSLIIQRRKTGKNLLNQKQIQKQIQKPFFKDFREYIQSIEAVALSTKPIKIYIEHSRPYEALGMHQIIQNKQERISKMVAVRYSRVLFISTITMNRFGIVQEAKTMNQGSRVDRMSNSLKPKKHQSGRNQTIQISRQQSKPSQDHLLNEHQYFSHKKSPLRLKTITTKLY